MAILPYLFYNGLDAKGLPGQLQIIKTYQQITNVK
jgi:hypothetical protein